MAFNEEADRLNIGYYDDEDQYTGDFEDGKTLKRKMNDIVDVTELPKNIHQSQPTKYHEDMMDVIEDLTTTV